MFSSIKASVLNRPTFCESSAIGHLLVPEVVDRAEVLRFQDVSALRKALPRCRRAFVHTQTWAGRSSTLNEARRRTNDFEEHRYCDAN